MYTKRKQDRRSFGGNVSFPLIAKGGCLVEGERRSIPDRRLGNIHLELIDATCHGFPDCIDDKPYYLTDLEDRRGR
jgi:hypothetical protein